MYGDGEWPRPPEQFFDHQQCGFNLYPLPTQLAPCDIGEFVENLHAYDPAFGQQRLGTRAARVIGGEGIDQNIGVEETAIGHWPLPVRSGIPSATAS